MKKPLPAKKPQAKAPPAKKQIPVKKQAPDRIDELVKKHLGNIADAENAFKSASALLDKHKTNYPELEQYVEHVSPAELSIQILEDIKDPRRAHYIFKILLSGVEAAYQVAHPGEKDHTNVDRAGWISTFEEASDRVSSQKGLQNWSCAINKRRNWIHGQNLRLSCEASERLLRVSTRS